MTDDKTINNIIDIITDRILTPVLYMYKADNLEFICFCDGNMPISEFREVERDIINIIGVSVEIVDIREFEEAERLDIICNAELVYTANEIIKMAFERAMMADAQRLHKDSMETLERGKETGSYYMH